MEDCGVHDCPLDVPAATEPAAVHSPGHAEAHQVIYGLCGVCPGGCGVEIHLQDGKISRLAPWKGHPQGICCPRGAHAAEIVYSPDRLRYPLKRVGERGEGRFARISWDEALDAVAEGMRYVAQRYGPQAICMYTGRGAFDWTLCHRPGASSFRWARPTQPASALSVMYPMASSHQSPRSASGKRTCIRTSKTPN
ncbi:MAG: molybdopterin-dependent oxidoreductase [Anaerolineae bacterium]|nr:molybdopterin-dependent oxidoreductase [Anaerolineae bacterium]